MPPNPNDKIDPTVLPEGARLATITECKEFLERRKKFDIFVSGPSADYKTFQYWVKWDDRSHVETFNRIMRAPHGIVIVIRMHEG